MAFSAPLPASCELPQPARKGGLGRRASGSALRGTVGTQRRDVYTSLREFAGMTDQPGLHARRVHLRMKLQRQCMPAMAERLVRRERRAREQIAARRNVERISVPMQHRHAFQRRTAGRPAGFVQLDRRSRRPAICCSSQG